MVRAGRGRDHRDVRGPRRRDPARRPRPLSVEGGARRRGRVRATSWNPETFDQLDGSCGVASRAQAQRLGRAASRRLRARVRRREDGHRADSLELHPLERGPEDLAEALLGVAEVVEGAPPVVGLEDLPPQPGVLRGGPEDRGSEQDAARREDRGHVGDGSGLARERSREAVEHPIERGRVERPVDGERLEHVRLDGRDVQVLQPTGCVREDVHVGVEEGDRAGVGEAGSCQEVAGSGSHVEVAMAHVTPVTLDEARRRAPPDDRREDAKDQGVVDPEEQRGVLPLTLVGGVVTVHRARPPPRELPTMDSPGDHGQGHPAWRGCVRLCRGDVGRADA